MDEQTRLRLEAEAETKTWLASEEAETLRKVVVENCLAVARDANPDDITRSFIKETITNVLLFIKKHKDYGSGNVAGFGEVGVVVRCNDKFERLKNLIFSGNAPNNESIEDNWRDVSNYGTIGFMTHVGSWTGCKQFTITQK